MPKHHTVAGCDSVGDKGSATSPDEGTTRKS